MVNRTVLAVLALTLTAPALAEDFKPESRHCLNLPGLKTRMTNAHELLARDGKYWRNTAGGCGALMKGRAYSIDTSMTQICSGDIITIYEGSSGFGYGACTLDQWERTPKPAE